MAQPSKGKGRCKRESKQGRHARRRQADVAESAMLSPERSRRAMRRRLGQTCLQREQLQPDRVSGFSRAQPARAVTVEAARGLHRLASAFRSTRGSVSINPPSLIPRAGVFVCVVWRLWRGSVSLFPRLW